MRSYKDITYALNSKHINLMDICRRSNVSYGTLVSLKQGTANPTISTLDAVFNAILNTETHKDCKKCVYYFPDKEIKHGVCEMAGAAFTSEPESCGFHCES